MPAAGDSIIMIIMREIIMRKDMGYGDAILF